MSDRSGPQDRITGFWSMVAPDYEARPGNVPAPDSAEHEEWVKALAALLPAAPADVLDIGTGTGFLARVAADLGHRVTAIDLSAAMLSEARRSAMTLGLEIRFEQADAVDPGLEGESFDVIMSRHLIWTLRTPVEAFRNWRRLLRPGGRLIAIDAMWFIDPDAEDSPTGPFEEAYDPETRDLLPTMTLADPTAIAVMFREAGFEDVVLDELAAVHAVSDAPPSDRPWYVITATRG